MKNENIIFINQHVPNTHVFLNVLNEVRAFTKGSTQGNFNTAPPPINHNHAKGLYGLDMSGYGTGMFWIWRKIKSMVYEKQRKIKKID